MKNLYTLLIASLFGTAYGQVPNNSFEQTTTEGNLKNWGIAFVQLATVDPETGESTSDNIIFENNEQGFSFPVADAHAGQQAMELRNAFNQTQNVVIAGQAKLFENEGSTTPTGWDLPIPLEEGAVVDRLAFYYKFFPLGNDVAEAKLELFSAESELVGQALIEISQASSGYTYVSTPVESFSTAVPVSMTITFSMQKYGSEPVFGSHLIIDDVAVNNSTMGIDGHESAAISVYPAVARDYINISGDTQDISFSIIDMNGSLVHQGMAQANRIDVSTLASGLYVLKAQTGNRQLTAKFIRE